MILEHELKSHETSFDNPGLFSNFTYVKMKGPNKQLSNQSIKKSCFSYFLELLSVINVTPLPVFPV